MTPFFQIIKIINFLQLITREKEAMTLQSELNEAVSDLMKSKERNEEAESMLFETVKKNETLQREFDDVKCEKYFFVLA